jgi:hypothetical protein
MYWEVRVSHHGFGMKVETVSVPENGTIEDAVQAASDEYGDAALAVRRWDGEPWTEIED